MSDLGHNSTVRRLNVEELPARPKAQPLPPEHPLRQILTTEIYTAPVETPSLATEKSTTNSPRSSALEVMVAVLSARGLLFLALLGAFVLSFRTMMFESTLSLEVLGVYCLFAILPVAYLEIRRQQ